MKIRRALFPLITVALCLCGASSGFGSVGGSSGNEAGLSGTVYNNLNNVSINFELVLTGNIENLCPVTFTWTDGNNQAQSVKLGVSTSVSSSLPPNGTITWTAV